MAIATGLLVLALAACSPGGTDESPRRRAPRRARPHPTDSPTTPEPGTEPTDGTSTPSDDATEAPLPFPANTDPDTQDPSADAALTVTDVRVGHHDGFDRVVFELGGTGTPGWRVEYVDQPVDDGRRRRRRRRRRVPAGHDLRLGVPHGHRGRGVRRSEPRPGGDDGEVEEVLLRGVFEGYTQAFVGVDDERRPFRVFSLEDPARVVVDVRDDG